MAAPKQNLLFLDFDGVMQPDYTRSQALSPTECATLKQRMAQQFNDDYFRHLGPDDIAAVLYDWRDVAVAAVRRICEEANARIIVSSSWRLYDEDAALLRLLKLRGLDRYFLCGLPRSFTEAKEALIRKYVAENSGSIAGYVAVDDANFRSLPGHFIRVKGGYLTDADAEAAIALLRGYSG